MNEKINIVMTGVGGQGVITAANILGKAAIKAKKNVLVSEIHGLAQRGGAVISTVRIGNVHSSLIPSGTANVILSMEPIEALRYITYAHKKTKIITDVNPVFPINVKLGDEEYPNLKDIFNEIKNHGELYKIDALNIAKESGNILTKNVVMLGALSETGVLPFKSDILLTTILESFPEEYRDINKTAYYGGIKAIKNKIP